MKRPTFGVSAPIGLMTDDDFAVGFTGPHS